MSRQESNVAFAKSSFLYGGNARYLEDLEARFEADPKALDAEWRAFFEALKEDRASVEKTARGPSWQRADWPLVPRDDLAALGADGWAEVDKTIGDKIKARCHVLRDGSRGCLLGFLKAADGTVKDWDGGQNTPIPTDF